MMGPKRPDLLAEPLGHEIDLILRIGAAQTEAQCATGLGV